jgi:flagellar hook-associated protein 2
MGLITASGIGSNIDIDSIIGALVDAQRTPAQQRLDLREANIQAEISGFGSLSSALSDFKTAVEKLNDLSEFTKRTASSSDSAFVTVSAGSNATPATFSVDVLKTAKGSRLESGLFTSASDTVGSGTLTLTAGSNSFSVTIDATDTLSAIRDKINDATDNFGVNVNIVNGDAGTILVLDSSITGSANSLVVSNDNTSLDPISTALTVAQAADDAQIQIAGQTVTSSTNTFTTAVEDLTITAVKATTTPVDISVSLDTGSVRSAVNDFVEAFNSLQETISSLSVSDPDNPGILSGDATVRMVDSQIRRIIGDRFTGSALESLSQIGITTTRTGTLEVDSSVLNNAIDNNFEDIGNLFAGTNGVAGRLVDLVDQYIGSGGLLTSRTTTLNEQLSAISDERAELDRRLSALETRLRAQYGAMDALVAQFNSTGQFLSQQLSNLPGFGGNKSGN